MTAWLLASWSRAGVWTAALAFAILALPPFRTLNQFSIASFAPAVAGVLLAERHPRLAGVAIGLSLIKPHIGGPALLWALVSRRWQTAAIAAVTQAALIAIYLAHAAVPLNVPGEYLQAIARTQNRGDLIAGETSLQPLVAWLPLTPLTLQMVIAVALTGALLLIWSRRGKDVDLTFFAAACLLSLLSFRHLGYNLLLAIPALVWAVSHEQRRVRILGFLAFVTLAASPPTFWRYIVEPAGGGPAAAAAAAHAYRAVVAMLFVVLALQPGRR